MIGIGIGVTVTSDGFQGERAVALLTRLYELLETWQVKQ